MQKIKVAEVITRLDWGGAPDIVRILCRHLDPDLYNITLIVGYTENPTAKTREFLNGFKEHIVVIPFLKRNINPFFDFTALVKLYLLFKRKRFDIVHTNTAKAGVLGRIAASLAGVRVIIHTPHGHNFYGYFNPFMSRMVIILERILARFTKKIICLTELEKNDFLRFRVADKSKIVVIYQGLELDSYINLVSDRMKTRDYFNIREDEYVVGMIGRLEHVKGVEYFIYASRDVAEKFPNTRFVIAGEGSLCEKLENQVRELKLEKRFIFAGWREDVSILLSIFDILVLPSLNEAVGMVLIEAQAVGVPVVATNVGGIPEIVKDGETGILVPPRDSGSLVIAINSLLGDKEKRFRMGKQGRLWVIDRFKANDMVNKISELYKNK